ncbi:arylsulfatase A-like enzyme [Krasilnikovia cinnamomea]|uniref:Arylsulfatase A-like enzyme n=1 Tax=Krasilnikovia cinnamomea TaxID=349313 RepID=A0A4Q7ZSC0_9ACTN|nr:sulfatase-like hydrolase/transferase [Krasilnikovia cinnamomea]RZU53513.1 arylsulfatase A-like enzyme [Krasilnikovia cinnamomea]
MGRAIHHAALGWVAAACAAALTGPPSAATAAAQEANTRPNILILLMDDARTGMTSVMPKATAWMNDGGTTFPAAVVTTPSCCPSRSSILSGRYAHNTGVTQQTGIGNYDHGKTLEHDLKAAGYRTAVLGKLFNGWNNRLRPPYFDNYALGVGYNNTTFTVDGKRVTAPYSTTFIGQQVNRYLDAYEQSDATPWFVYAGFTAPHPPFIPEPKYAKIRYSWSGNPAVAEKDLSDKPAYVRNFHQTLKQGAATRQAMLRTLLSVDDAVDAIHRHLDALGESNTLVFLLSDNGRLLSEHRLPTKFMPYLQAEQVPFFMRWPGHLPRTRDSRLAANIDVTPTALAAAGLTPSYTYDGRNLLAAGGRDRLLFEYWRDPANGAGIPTWAATYVAGRYLYTEIYRDDRTVLDREYYNLATDPWQLTNLFRDRNPANDPAIAPLSAALADQRTCTGRACP